MNNIHTVLFDLDGTLLDTAPDLAYALNQQLLKHGLPELPLATIRPHVGYGVRALLKVGFQIDANHPRHTALTEEFLALYQTHLARETILFPGIERVLQHLDDQHIPWGIVTNKPARFTFDLLKAMQLHHRAACIICGDSLSKRKPDPDQILHALAQLNTEPRHCLYIGDTEIDVIASKAAGTHSLVALYGYVMPTEDPYTWQADGYVQQAIDIIEWLSH